MLNETRRNMVTLKLTQACQRGNTPHEHPKLLESSENLKIK